MIKGVIVKGEADHNKKSCFDCYHLQAAQSWWCVNEEATKYRGTAKGGVIKCHFWKPAIHISELSFFDKLFGNYIEIDCSSDKT